MSGRFSVVETRRVARLARLALAADEELRLARELHDIAEAFASLAAYAEGLPESAPRAGGALRDDVARPAVPAVADAVLAQAPHVDDASRSVRAPRGTIG